MNWEDSLIETGALWKHDGNPKRPYALLTTGNISDTYINGSKIVAKPNLVAQAAKEVVAKIPTDSLPADVVVVGQMKGSVTFASRIAEELDATFIWVNKSADNPDKAMEIDSRFDPELYIGKKCIVVEDVLNTGDTSLRTITTLSDAGCKALPYIPCIVNRNSEVTVSDFRIIACCKLKTSLWQPGCNPHTQNGAELVPPIRPKSIDGHLLKAVYET